MIDQHAATELRLYIENDGRLYEIRTVPTRKSLAAKKARNVYKHDLAVTQFGHLVEAGAKKYAKEFGGEWHKLFPAPTRKAVAEDLTRAFEVEFALGNYNGLLPTKYQKPKDSTAKQSSHARKKDASSSSVKWNVPEGIKIAWSPLMKTYLALWPPGKDRQVIWSADTEDMHAWLQDTYGAQYGLAKRASPLRPHASKGHASRNHHSTISLQDMREFRGFLRNATDRQVQGIYEKEQQAGRDAYAELARAEAEHRGIELDHAGSRYALAHKKNSAQLDREVSQALARRR